MRSFQTLASAAVIAAALGFAAPAAAHATAVKTDACSAAVAAAQNAEAAFQAAIADAKKQIAAGGHLGAAEESNLLSLRDAANMAASTAGRICGGNVPHGNTTTGVGSTSQGADATEIALGAALVGAAGLGVVAARRRRAADGTHA